MEELLSHTNCVYALVILQNVQNLSGDSMVSYTASCPLQNLCLIWKSLDLDRILSHEIFCNSGSFNRVEDLSNRLYKRGDL